MSRWATCLFWPREKKHAGRGEKALKQWKEEVGSLSKGASSRWRPGSRRHLCRSPPWETVVQHVAMTAGSWPREASWLYRRGLKEIFL